MNRFDFIRRFQFARHPPSYRCGGFLLAHNAIIYYFSFLFSQCSFPCAATQLRSPVRTSLRILKPEPTRFSTSSSAYVHVAEIAKLSFRHAIKVFVSRKSYFITFSSAPYFKIDTLLIFPMFSKTFLPQPAASLAHSPLLQEKSAL